MRVYMGRYPKNPAKERKIDVRIDKWDTWNMDSTLTPIILPMLKQLKITKHGSPGNMPAFHFDSNQYPQMCFDFYSSDDDKAWDEGHKQWEEIMDKMIWSFEQLDTEWEQQFHTGETDYQWVPVEGKDLVEMKYGPNHTHKFDFVGYTAHLERIREGLRFFGEHFMDLWD